MSEKKLEDLVEFFVLGNEPCIGFYESKVEKLGISIYDFQKQLKSALKLQESLKAEIKRLKQISNVRDLSPGAHSIQEFIDMEINDFQKLVDESEK